MPLSMWESATQNRYHAESNPTQLNSMELSLNEVTGDTRGTCVKSVPIDQFCEELDDIWRTVSWVYSSILKNFAVLGSVLGGSALAMVETTTYAAIQNQRARASTKRKTTIKWIRIHVWWSFCKMHDRELALQLSPWTALESVESTSKKISQMNLGRATTK